MKDGADQSRPPCVRSTKPTMFLCMTVKVKRCQLHNARVSGCQDRAMPAASSMRPAASHPLSHHHGGSFFDNEPGRPSSALESTEVCCLTATWFLRCMRACRLAKTKPREMRPTRLVKRISAMPCGSTRSQSRGRQFDERSRVKHWQCKRLQRLEWCRSRLGGQRWTRMAFTNDER